METLRVALVDIKQKLKDNLYQNEEHVRLSLVARLLLALGWDVWNPAEVNAEFKTTEDTPRKVDLSLFTKPRSPAVFIEVKAIGGLVKNLQDAEKQMQEYLRNYSAPICILSDGRIWRFYCVYANRLALSEKLFKSIDLLNDDLDELETVFTTYLNKENHLIEAHQTYSPAHYEAKKLMDLTERERQICECIPEA